MLGSIVGPAVVGETETVGAEVVVVGEEVVDDGSGLAPAPQAESKIEAAKTATGVFFTVPPTVLSCFWQSWSPPQTSGRRDLENNHLRTTPHKRS
jgi:hypothetical protein